MHAVAFGHAASHPLIPQHENTAAATDLISFLKALPDCRMRRGIRFPQWWMLLVAILAILSQVDPIDSLICDGKTLRRSIAENASGAERFIAQVSLYANSLGVAIAQSTNATDEGGEITALRALLEHVDLEGVLVQADALHANSPFFSTSRSAKPIS